MKILALVSIISISVVSVCSFPINSNNGHTILKDTDIYRRAVNYNNDAGSVAAATTVDTTTAAIAGLDSAGKVGAATGAEVVKALVDTGLNVVSIAGAGLSAAGSASPGGNPPTGY